MMRRVQIPDPTLLLLTLLVSVIGVFFIFDAGYARSLSEWRGWLPAECRSQLIWLGVAVLMSFVCASVRPEAWKRYAKPIWLVVFVLLVLVKVMGHRTNGAQRWIGAGGFAIQPAEFAKLATVLFVAAVFADRPTWPKRIPRCRNWAQTLDSVWMPKIARFMPAVFVLASVFLIEVEPDLGTAAVVAVIAFAMFLPGGVSRKSLVLAILIAVVGSWALVHKESYRLQRFTHHSERWASANVDDAEYQTVQSELAQADGGLFGVGLGAGRAKHILPATTTDFIMATIGEETGFVGSITVLGLLGALVWRLSRHAQRADSRFKMLVLYGVGAWIGIQSCVNVMMANAFLPTIGIPLPFISSGGSSLVALWMAMGVCQATLVSQKDPMRSSKEEPIEAGPDGWRNRRARLSGA